MRRILRCAWVAVLTLALTASGAMLGGVAHAAAHGPATQHTASGKDDFHAGHAHHGHADHDHSAALDDTPLAPHDHGSKTCCSMCTVASPLPPSVTTAAPFESRPTEYASRGAFGIAVIVRVDPGIPKRIG